MAGSLVSPKPGTLFIVATPLGNLGDISERARSTFGSVACVAAEDTRRTRILLNHLGVRPRLISLHAHSPRSRVQQVVSLLESGASIALVTDAGTPTVSDPGAELVREARKAGIPVVAVPGPSAVAAALSISGFNADRYIFLGFLPRHGKERERLLAEAAVSPITSVVFESPNRLVDLLDELVTRCGAEREVAVARELTKIHEELKSGPVGEIAEYYREHAPRGEITLLLAGAAPDSSQDFVDRTEEIRDRARTLLAGGASRRDVAQIVARELRLSRNEAYRMVTTL